MTWAVFAPAVLTLGLSLLVGWRGPHLHPAWSAKILLSAAVVTALAVLGTLALVVTVFILGALPTRLIAAIPGAGALEAHGPVTVSLGVTASGVFAMILVATALFLARTARERVAVRHDSTALLETGEPIAAAIPGRHGGVIVSKGLLRLLGPRELQAVFQHERAHLRHRHHLYLTVSAFVVQIIPPMARLHETLRFHLERWADEEAAEAVNDRALVARAIARVALARPTQTLPYPGAANFHVVERVRALLSPPPSKNLLAGPVALSGAVVTTAIATASLQLHHLSLLL